MKNINKSRINIVLYGVSLALCFLVFQQADLVHTYVSSYAYLNDHIYDFYDFNKPYMVRNDYLPSIYIIFSLWGLPLKSMGLISSPEHVGVNLQAPTYLELLWFKLLLVIIFFACVLIVRKISEMIEPGKVSTSIAPALLLSTSPIAIFAVFVFGQYDIVGVLFTLMGLHCYFERKFWKFSFFLSIAISFKYFAVLLYIPLVLLVEKRPSRLFRFGLIGVAATAIQIAAYWHSDVFQESFLYFARLKASHDLHTKKPVLLAIFYFLICSYSYFSRFKIDPECKAWSGSAIFVCTLSYAIMFSHVQWHPQWLLILMPFFALASLYLRYQRTFIVFELVGFLAYIWISVNWYPKNVDVTMIQHGILSKYLPPITFYGGNIFQPAGMPAAKLAFYIFLYSPFLFWLCENVNLVRGFIRSRILKQNPASFSQSMAALKPNGSGIDPHIDPSLTWLYRARGVVAGYGFLVITAYCIYRSGL